MAVVNSNGEISTELNAVRTRWNSGSTIHLYTNNFTPVATMTIGSFTEASYTGYAAQSLNAQWQAVVKIKDGEYQMSTPVLTWNAPSSGAPQTVYGYWIDDGTNVLAADLFAAPITQSAGGPGFQLTVNIDEWTATDYP